LNRSWVLFHLTEAVDALHQTIGDLSKDPDYSGVELAVDMQHIYHHLNTAWNSRDSNGSDVEPGSDELFNRWSQFPSDLDMMTL
jgi:hypothetical protein